MKGRTAVELRISKEAYEMRAVARHDVVALQMERNVAKRLWVAINI